MRRTGGRGDWRQQLPLGQFGRQQVVQQLPPRRRRPRIHGLHPDDREHRDPHKAGCAARAPVARGDAPHGDGGTIKQQDCSHRIDFSLTPAQFAEGVAPNPLWDLHAQRPIGDPPFVRRPVDDIDRNFCANSTFSGAYNQGFQVRQQDYPSNVLLTGQLRPPGSRVIVPTEVGGGGPLLHLGDGPEAGGGQLTDGDQEGAAAGAGAARARQPANLGRGAEERGADYDLPARVWQIWLGPEVDVPGDARRDELQGGHV